MLSPYLQLAKSLRIPKDLRVCLRSDSTLTLFKTGLAEYEYLGLKDSSAMLCTNGIKNRHTYEWDASVWDGSTLDGPRRRLSLRCHNRREHAQQGQEGAEDTHMERHF